MKQEHEIVALVYEARGNNEAASRLVSQYLPFIKSETAKYIKRVPQEGRDDELSLPCLLFMKPCCPTKKHGAVFWPMQPGRSKPVD